MITQHRNINKNKVAILCKEIKINKKGVEKENL